MYQIPDSHRALIDGLYCAVLTTVMPDGQPQTTPVWYNRDDDFFYINTMRGFRKEQNMRLNPRVTLLMYDPCHPLHYIEIRSIVVEMTEVGALAHLDALTQRYMNRPDARFFGDAVPADLQARYTPVKITLSPHRIRVEG